MRAADDFATIRARMEELQRERERTPRKDDPAMIRHFRSVPIEEIARVAQKKPREFLGLR